MVLEVVLVVLEVVLQLLLLQLLLLQLLLLQLRVLSKLPSPSEGGNFIFRGFKEAPKSWDNGQ